MIEKILNNEMSISYPEGFHVMDKEELKGQQFLQEGPGWCISDPDRHIVVSAAWRKTNGLIARMLNTRDVAKNMSAQIRKPMQKFGFQLEGFLQKEMGGLRADGYLYQYVVQGTGMAGESFCIKKGSTFYYIHCYFRQALKDESLAVLEEIFQSVTWK